MDGGEKNGGPDPRTFFKIRSRPAYASCSFRGLLTTYRPQPGLRLATRQRTDFPHQPEMLKPLTKCSPHMSTECCRDTLRRCFRLSPKLGLKRNQSKLHATPWKDIYPRLDGACGVMVKTRSARTTAILLAFKYRCAFDYPHCNGSSIGIQMS